MVPFIQSLTGLQQFILRRLGSPVINVELTTDQLNDSINLSVKMYNEVAYNGVKLKIGTFQLVSGQTTYVMDYSVNNILYVFNPMGFSILGDMTSEESVFQVSDYLAMNFLQEGYYSIGGNIMLEWTLFQQFAETFAMKFSPIIEFNFNSATKELQIQGSFSSPYSPTLGYIYYESVDPYSTTNPQDVLMLNDIGFLDYVTAMAKVQWGTNLIKYSGSALPSGLLINGDKILEKGEKELEEARDRLYTYWQEPADFYVG